MKLIRYLLSHALLIGFFVALGMGYYYRTHLFSEDVNTRIDHTVYRLMVLARLSPEQAESVTPTAQVDQGDQIPSGVTQSPRTDDQSAQTESVISPPPADAVSSPETEQLQTDVQTATETTEATEEVTEQAVESTSPAESVLAETQRASESAVVQENVEVDSSPIEEQEQIPAVSADKEAITTSHAELINQARLAFQSGDSKKAITLYQELSSLNPDDPNAYGELGNIFYIQGKWKQAGQAYYEATVRLLRRGQTGQVQYLYRVIHGLDRESAEKLRSQLGR